MDIVSVVHIYPIDCKYNTIFQLSLVYILTVNFLDISGQAEMSKKFSQTDITKDDCLSKLINFKLLKLIII